MRPQVITNPAAQPASRLAGTVTRATGPKTATSSGVTPSWAPRVTDSGSRHHRPRSDPAPGSRALITGPITRIPSEAATESRNPTEAARNGSTVSRAITAIDRARTPAARPPVPKATTATPAVTVARRTDGSSRVATAKTARTAIVARILGHQPRRRIHGPMTARTNATF